MNVLLLHGILTHVQKLPMSGHIIFAYLKIEGVETMRVVMFKHIQLRRLAGWIMVSVSLHVRQRYVDAVFNLKNSQKSSFVV